MIKTVVRRGAARLYQSMWLPRAITLGVRAAVLADESVFLVKHTYLDGWYLPGGGVDRGEHAEAAIVRELREEGGIACHETPRLHGLLLNGTRDHVACYVVRRFDHDPAAAKANGEIAEARFFPVEALPEGTTAATRARLGEILTGRPAPARW